MASAIRQMTGVGGDVRKIARLLQKKAPPGHMLAYISQEEADLLKARGGSGKLHEDTGVPSFEEEYVPDYSPTGGGDQPSVYQRYDNPQTSTYGSGETTAFPDAAPIQTSAPNFVSPGAQLASNRYSSVQPVVTADAQPNNVDAAFVPVGSYNLSDATPAFTAGRVGDYSLGGVAKESPYALGAAKLPAAANTGTPAEKGFFESLSKDTKARLGIGGAQAILGAYQVSQAMEQAKKYREDMAKLAQPYQEEGKKLISQAQSGQLTPAAQQQLQAAQAQAAQGAQARGGVGAQQAMMAVENMRQQLLQNQYDYGLKVTGIGDSIASGAIRTGMDADRYVNQLASSYASNVARTLSNAPTYVNSYSQIT